MVRSTLETSIEGIRSVWGPLSRDVVAHASGYLQNLLEASPTEAWLAALHQEALANQELARDPVHGFVLLAHTEPTGLYRPPHDHGRNWVIYAIQRGEIEMGIYARLEDPDGRIRLVKRGCTRVLPGEVKVYLPGEIHDTRCVSGPALLFRFTERDLKQEDHESHRVTRYVERNGEWTVGSA